MTRKGAKKDGTLSGVRNFGKRLRKARLQAGLTQEQAAHKAGLHQPGWATYEAGHVLPYMDTAERLAHAVGVELKDLV
jgi:transcriptional regulator with XRE-family HTH domain